MINTLSKKHIYWLTPLIALFFTYAGVEESLLEVLTHPDFWFNLLFNGLQIYALFFLTYYLHFNKQFGLIKSLLISISAFVVMQIIQVFIVDYEPEDFTELYSITLPFGALILFGINFYYSKYRDAKSISEKIEQKKIETFWLQTSQGKHTIRFSEFRYAYINNIHLRLKLHDKEVNSFITLKELEGLLVGQLDCFRLNKQYLADHSGVISFKPLKDGRLLIRLFDDNETIVSKNKAANFKLWVEQGA